MSAESSVDAAAPNLNLNTEEKRVYGQLFRHADTDNVGVVTGDVAVKFFEKTRLDSRVLGEIWQLADRENRGFLTPAGFSIVLRLIGHAQAGREPTQEVALQQGPIPRFDGFTPTPAAPPAAQPLQAQGTGGTPIRIPPLTPEKVSQYAGLFERQNLQAGNLLPGEHARVIFEKSGLPNELLGRIWQLADTEQRGALVMTEFVIAMHLLTSLKTGQLRGLPNVLPAALYEAATRRVAAPRQSPTATGPPLSAIPRQLSGQTPLRQASPLGRAPQSALATGLPISAQATGLQPQSTGSDWVITPADKARFDVLYADLDKTNKGFVTGEEAVPFLSQSSLSEDALAQIWDLADINSQGFLTKDTFAVAMYLIRQQRSRRDGATNLPTSLPPNLIPPSLRAQPRAPPNVGASPFDAPEPPKPQPPPAPKSALDDLFGLDATPAPVQAPMATGGSAAMDPFANASPVAPGSPIHASPTGNQFKPFIPSSTFGRSLQPQDTGGSNASKPISAVDDLLGDNDPEISKRLTNETAELANLSNQIGSLSNQMQQVQGQRAVTQKEVSQTSQQKKNFEDRLSQLRTLYEKEAKEVADLKDQLQRSRDETRKLMTEMATLDGNYREIQTQHQQLTAALQSDQQENQSLKQKISAVNAEIAQLKPQVEKLKSDARQHKGLVAINKKQLSTVEGERDKLTTEADDLTRSHEALSRQVSTASPVAAPAQVASPAPSTASGNNPFFKRSGSADMMGSFTSPPPKTYNDKSFDDIFGGFGTGSTSSTPPPPPVSFKAQHTGNSTASAASFATPAASTPTTVSRQATLGAIEPPPPPVSRQISSSFLPFGDMSESLTSSRQASPPLSRAGDSNIPVAAAVPAPLEPAITGASAASNQDIGRSAPLPDEAVSPPISNGFIPGAFPEDTPRGEAGGVAPSFAGNRDSELFESMKKDPVNTKDDFDSAFASFGTSGQTQEIPKDTSTAFSGFSTEFPPISELDRDDDSESDSDGNGFDDDFAPSSPQVKKIDGQDTPRAASSPVATSTSVVPNEPAAEDATPSRQATSSIPSIFSQHAAALPVSVSKSHSEDPFAPASDFAPAPTTVTNTAPVSSNTAFDDLDDDFEGLEDAKEGSADDEFANISRSNLDEFNPVFDSSPPPSQPKSESTNASHAFGNDSSYDFGSISQPSGAPSQQATSTAPPASASSGAKAVDNHDWDSIFADLDEPNATAANESGKPHTLDESSDRPNLQNSGRALTQEGVHDDPILKNLTGMGYSRIAALNALEKYDYNLERAANFLANQS